MSGNFYSGRHVALLVLQHFLLLLQLMGVKIMGYMWDNRQVKRSKCFFSCSGPSRDGNTLLELLGEEGQE